MCTRVSARMWARCGWWRRVGRSRRCAGRPTAQVAAPRSWSLVRPIDPPAGSAPGGSGVRRERRDSRSSPTATRAVRLTVRRCSPTTQVVVDAMVAKIKALASTPFPVRFVLQTGDAVANGTNGTAWNVSYSPLVERITRDARRAVLPDGGQPRRRLRRRFTAAGPAQHALGAVQADPAGRVAAPAQRISDVRVWLRPSLRDRD